MALSSGRHTLTAQLNGYAIARRIFVLPDARTLYIPLAPSSGVLVLNSVPSGSAITVDGKPYGQTPATLHLSPGLHRILLTNGNLRREETVNIDADSFQTHAVHW